MWRPHFSTSLTVRSVQFSHSVMSDSATPWTSARQASLSITNSQSLLQVMSIESIMPSNHLILCNPLLLPPSIFPSIRVFSNESVLELGGKSIGVSASVLPMNIQDGFPLGWKLDLLSVPEKSLSSLQHHSSKESVLQHSAFFIVQLSHPYMTTAKTKALTRQIFVGEVISLYFNKLSRLVIAFLPRVKPLLISWLQSRSAVILEPLQNKVCHCFHCFPIYLP